MAMLWVKTFHIVLIAAWFAGLFYLPRIYVNLAMETDPAAVRRLLLMARKLFRFMTMIAVPALACGLWLWLSIGIGQGQGWIHAKVTVVLLLIVYHAYCGHLLRVFERGENRRTDKWYRVFNELPVLGMLAAVALVVIDRIIVQGHGSRLQRALKGKQAIKKPRKAVAGGSNSLCVTGEAVWGLRASP